MFMLYVQTSFNVNLNLKICITEVILFKMVQRQAVLTPCAYVISIKLQNNFIEITFRVSVLLVLEPLYIFSNEDFNFKRKVEGSLNMKHEKSQYLVATASHAD